MRRTLLVTSVAGGALAALLAGTAAVATTTSTAATATPTCSSDCTGTATGAGRGAEMRGNGNAQMRGNGNAQMRGNGNAQMRGNTSATHTDLPASGTLTTAQRTALAGMAEEEKLAHDVYVALAASTGDQRFTRIAASEAQHLSAVRTLLARYGIADPTAGKADGQFKNNHLQILYDDLLANIKDNDRHLPRYRRREADVADLDSTINSVNSSPTCSRSTRTYCAGYDRHLVATTS